MRIDANTTFTALRGEMNSILPTEQNKHLRSEGQELHTHGLIPHGKGQDAAERRAMKIQSATSKVQSAIENEYSKRYGPGFSQAVFTRVNQRYGTDLGSDGVRVKDLDRIKVAIGEEMVSRDYAMAQTIMARNDPDFGMRVLVGMGLPLDTPLNPLGCDPTKFVDFATKMEQSEQSAPRTAPYQNLSPQELHQLMQLSPTALKQTLLADQRLATRLATMSRTDLAIVAFRDGSLDPDGDAQRLSSALPNQYVKGQGGQPDQVTIGTKQYEFVKNLGGGGYGEGKLFRGLTDGELIVLKHEKYSGTEKGDPTQAPTRFRRAANEIRQHEALSSGPAGGGVVGFKGAVREGDDVWLAMAHAPNGDLSAFCPVMPTDRSAIQEALKSGLISPRVADLLQRSLMQDVLQVLSAIEQHHPQFRHMDFRPENLYLDAHGKPLAADMGTSTTGPVGFVPDAAIHMAPESAEGYGDAQARQGITNKADVYGAGTMLLRMLAGREMFAGVRWQAEMQDALKAFYAARNGYSQLTQTQKDAIAKVDLFVVDTRADRVRVKVSSDPMANQLANLLLYPDPTRRPTATRALQHAWFRDPDLGNPAIKTELQEVAALLSKPRDQLKQADLYRIANLNRAV
jgi:serine/threonine protein kinase